MFTSTKLRQIVGIDRAGSFSTAARLMNISQSTLTKAVADIETDLGYAVFLRTARGVVATKEGREFLNRAERIVDDFEMLIEDAKAQRAENEGILRIGISPASQEGLYNRIMAQLLKEHPEICLTLIGLEVERGIRMLKRGDLDLLFGLMEELNREPEFVNVSLGFLGVTLFCRKEHPLLEREELTFADVRDYKMISPDNRSRYAQRIAELLDEGDLDPRRKVHLIENFGIVEQAVASTDLIGIVSNAYASTSRFKRRFVELDIDVFEPLEIGAARLSRWMPNQGVKSCLSVIQRFPLK